jgi:hypothetical protein
VLKGEYMEAILVSAAIGSALLALAIWIEIRARQVEPDAAVTKK